MATYSAQHVGTPAVWTQLGFAEVGRRPVQGYTPGAVRGANNVTSPPRPPIIPETFKGRAVDSSSALFDWFEDFHVLPRSIELGNVLTDQSVAIEVFSAFRRVAREWTSFVNNAGTGIELVGEPSLAIEVPPLTGYTMTLEVSATGDPFVESSIDFVFDVGTISIPITLQRLVVWTLVPEMPFAEIAGALTDVLETISGREQRIALRKNPRQSFQFRYLIDDGAERQRAENLLFAWQSRTFGVPVWTDDTELTSAATAGDLVLNVGDTSYRDFRVGGLVIVYEDEDSYDVGTIAAFDATTITVESGILSSYAAGVAVYPIGTFRLPQTVRGVRWPVNLSTLEVVFRSTANDVDRGDLTPFDSLNGKLFVTENVFASGTNGETFNKRAVIIDSETGIEVVSSPWEVHRRGTTLTLRAVGRQAIHELRGLVYALRGRQVSFYLARSTSDLIPVATLSSGSATLDVTNVGFSQFAQQIQPRNLIRITFVDGSTPLIREILSSSISSATVEQLTMTETWSTTIAADEIARIEFVEKVRLDDDDVSIEIDAIGRVARVSAPVKVVLE